MSANLLTRDEARQLAVEHLDAAFRRLQMSGMDPVVLAAAAETTFRMALIQMFVTTGLSACARQELIDCLATDLQGDSAQLESLPPVVGRIH